MAGAPPRKKGAGKGAEPPKQHWVVTVVETGRAGVHFVDRKAGELAATLELEGGSVVEPKSASRFKKNHNMPKKSRDCCNFLIPADEDDDDPPPHPMFSVPSNRDSHQRELRQLQASRSPPSAVYAGPKPMSMPARPNCHGGGGPVQRDVHPDDSRGHWQYSGHPQPGKGHGKGHGHGHGHVAAAAAVGAGMGVAAMGPGLVIDHGPPIHRDFDDEEDTTVYEDLVLEDYEGPEPFKTDNSVAGDMWSALA